jgi:hypothetical protein
MQVRETIVTHRVFKLALTLALSFAVSLADMGRLSAQEVRDPDTTTSRPGTPDVDVTPDRPADPVDPSPDPTPGIDIHGNDRPDMAGRSRLTLKITKDISETIEDVANECSTYKPVYRVDCIRQGLQMTLARLPKTGEYADARKILQTAVAKLDRIVVENVDPEAPALLAAPNANPKLKKRRHYSAIRKDRLAIANRKAVAVIEEARTELLRSSENSERRYAHYQEIALAVGSTKVLLRSS